MARLWYCWPSVRGGVRTVLCPSAVWRPQENNEAFRRHFSSDSFPIIMPAEVDLSCGLWSRVFVFPSHSERVENFPSPICVCVLWVPVEEDGSSESTDQRSQSGRLSHQFFRPGIHLLFHLLVCLLSLYADVSATCNGKRKQKCTIINGLLIVFCNCCQAILMKHC